MNKTYRIWQRVKDFCTANPGKSMDDGDPRSAVLEAVMKVEVICLRIPGTQDAEWRVIADGRMTTPSFGSKGASLAYVDMIQSGRRKPEFHKDGAR